VNFAGFLGSVCSYGGFWVVTQYSLSSGYQISCCLFCKTKQNGIKAQADYIHTIKSLIYIKRMMTFFDKHRIILTFIHWMRSLIYARQLSLLTYTGWQALHRPYSWITKIYDRKNHTIRIYETCTDRWNNSKIFSQKVVFHHSSHFCR
jgi:hypothetical protein